MQLNNTSQYIIRILSYIANDKSKSLHSAKKLSEILDIPYKFLTKIMTDLVKQKFVISLQGREGGFKLAREASQITVADILDSFNDSIDDQQCILGIGKCDGTNKCGLHDQWVEPKQLIQNMFNNTTLENLNASDIKI